MAQRVLYIAVMVVFTITIINFEVSLLIYLLIILGLTLSVILLLNYYWYSMKSMDEARPDDKTTANNGYLPLKRDITRTDILICNLLLFLSN